jgi:hypothetical protein
MLTSSLWPSTRSTLPPVGSPRLSSVPSAPRRPGSPGGVR